MSKVSIVIDSTTKLPPNLVEEFDIRTAPAILIWSGEELRDGVDIQPTEFYARLETADEMPTTSQATPAVFKRIYDDLLEKGNDILTIVCSHKLSGTLASALQAREMLADKRIEIIDSLSGAMGVGWSVIAAARAAAQGATLEKCKSIAEKALKNTGLLLTVDTLEFLHRGGRIGGVQKFFGSLMNLKPIIEVVDGSFEGLERVRTLRKSLDRLIELMIARIGDRKPVYLATMHANALELAQKMEAKAIEILNPVESIITEVSPAVGVHMGPGAVGYAFMAGAE